MGRKMLLGKIPKNFECKRQAAKKRSRGRPKKHSSPPIQPIPVEQTSLNVATLHKAIPSDSQWVDRSFLPDKIILCKLRVTDDDSPLITHFIVVHSDLSWKVTIHNQQVPSTCSKLSRIPSKLIVESFKSLILLVDTCSVCPGHPDKHFVNLLESKKGKLLSKDGSKVASIDAIGVTLNGEAYSKTVRHSKCELLVGNGKCSACVTYRDSLRKIYHRWLTQKSLSSSRQESTSSRINFTHLNTPKKRRRYSNLRLRLENKEKQLERTRDKIDHLMKVSGVIVGQQLSNDFKSIMADMTEDMRKNNPPDSFKRVFWEQQLAAVNASDVRQIRWHPAIIKWCLHMKFLSSGAYHAMPCVPQDCFCFLLNVRFGITLIL